MVSEQQSDEVVVKSPRVVSNSGGDEFACVVKEVAMGFKQCGQFFIEIFFFHREC